MSNMHKGDKVTWNTVNGKTKGVVTRKVTRDSAIGGHKAKASPDNPQYELKSEKTGKKAIHKPESLD